MEKIYSNGENNYHKWRKQQLAMDKSTILLLKNKLRMMNINY